MTQLPSGYFEMTRAEYDKLDVCTAREVFKKSREVLDYFVSRDVSKPLIEAKNPVTPTDWIMAVQTVIIGCERCHESGTYTWGGTINGKPVHSAPCARCAGKGKLNFDDMRRGRAYDNYAIARACRG